MEAAETMVNDTEHPNETLGNKTDNVKKESEEHIDDIEGAEVDAIRVMSDAFQGTTSDPTPSDHNVRKILQIPVLVLYVLYIPTF